MSHLLVALIVGLVGLTLWLVPFPNAKVNEAGRILFMLGAFFAMLAHRGGLS
jgi:hypothetical protein